MKFFDINWEFIFFRGGYIWGRKSCVEDSSLIKCVVGVKKILR